MAAVEVIKKTQETYISGTKYTIYGKNKTFDEKINFFVSTVSENSGFWLRLAILLHLLFFIPVAARFSQLLNQPMLVHQHAKRAG